MQSIRVRVIIEDTFTAFNKIDDHALFCHKKWLTNSFHPQKHEENKQKDCDKKLRLETSIIYNVSTLNVSENVVLIKFLNVLFKFIEVIQVFKHSGESYKLNIKTNNHYFCNITILAIPVSQFCKIQLSIHRLSEYLQYILRRIKFTSNSNILCGFLASRVMISQENTGICQYLR